MKNVPPAPTTTPDDGGGIKKAALWFVVLGSIGAILMGLAVYHSAGFARPNVESNDGVTTTK